MTMKNRMAFSSILILLLCACNMNIKGIQGSGKVAREERPVQEIRGVTLATIGDMTIELGEEESLTIEAEDNLLPYLETDVRGGMLTIHNESNSNLRPTAPIHYFLTVNSLETLAVTSIGNIDAPALQADMFTAKTSSSGSLHLAGLDANSLQVEVSSNGDIVIDAGQVDQQDITISSSGVYRGGDVSSATTTVEISSSGDATVWVTDSLNAHLSSSGNVNYYGTPEITQSMSSSGKVVSLGNK
jgi:hypothetical protein